MLNYTDSKLTQLIIHHVGSKLNDEGYTLSDSVTKKYTPAVESILTNYFLSPFKQSEFYTFWHESDLNLNNCFSFARDIFENKRSFVSKSKNLAKLLYENSMHPKIKGGELYISYFEDCVVDNETVDAIGIFKSESKDTFLQPYQSEDHFEIKSMEGTNIDKVDKGCIIFNTKEEGFKVCIVDNTNKSGEAQYWRDSFLKLTSLMDSYHYTSRLMGLAKDYVTNQLTEEFEVSKTEQIDLLNKSSKYFKTHENFDKREFENEVFEQPELIKSFRTFNKEYYQENQLDPVESFTISVNAVKKQSRIFKSVLKLDKNFHVYIHGDRDLIERGVDEDGRKYYKIYYKEEN
ncbi:hypothetical protein WSM22_06450 [Cytophagales bacterium WSM2-2]|nr:hypothetical protein WSM22_06450 [Cytophagales bacterium WSM2-2]